MHAIPALGAEPAPLHYDVHYLLIAAPGQRLSASAESHELAWFARAQARAILDDESPLRVARKAELWLQSVGACP